MLTAKNTTPKSQVIALPSAVLSPDSRASLKKKSPLKVNMIQPKTTKRRGEVIATVFHLYGCHGISRRDAR